MTDPDSAADLQRFVDDALALLDNYRPVRGPVPTEPLESLLDQCLAQTARLAETGPEPLRLIHHFACTGGTLMTRALACQPNTMVLSEVDPFSRWFRPPGSFAPSDLIFLARQCRLPPTEATIERMFVAALRSLWEDTFRDGRRLVLRDHSHSHFCTATEPSERPLMGAMLARHFELRQVITVRHPLDSFVSLHLMNSAKGPVAHLEGYAARYLAFLDAYPEVQIRYFEDFARDPETECRALTEILALPFDPRWQDLLQLISMSGDSGRKGRRIELRPRRPLPEVVQADLATPAPSYEALCARLGYDPDPAGAVTPAR
ncbi:sulfotransferase family protein [Rhodobacter maris]|uniref:Sulfotransferase family protein n=1 Tax=Rhodobacter maris TaxID=446682 RepID=A0A285SG95_9RHOB|nr:hypothetical protein [Rhodobacter maris]SOC06896.1 hypothetical protein SAMN05877831_105174 [Rhodobacter maris]